MPAGEKMTLTIVTLGTNYQIVTFMTIEQVREEIGTDHQWCTFTGLNERDEPMTVEILARWNEERYIRGFTFQPFHPPPIQAQGVPISPEMLARMKAGRT